jgi:predicted CXXCH cytochrome family protein
VRRILLPFIGGAFWLFLAAIPVLADGGPHVLTVNNGSAGITADSCAGCHRAHTSTSPTGMLLTDPSPTITGYCRSCHGTSGTGAATDVDTGVQYSLGTNGLRTGTTIGALRSGGFVQARIGSADGSRLLAAPLAETKNAFIPVKAPTAVTSAHLALPGTGLTATNIVWGNGGISSSVYGPTLAAPMECTSCHNPHGNGNYRILDTLPAPGAAAATSPAVVIGSLVSPSTRNTAVVPNTYTGTWTAVTGMAVKDSPYVAGRQKNYTVIAKAPVVDYTAAQPIPVSAAPLSSYLLYTDQLTGATLSNPLTGDYLKKFLTYNANEESLGTVAVPSTTITNFYDGPNGSPNQGGFTTTGGRYTDFPENAPGSASAGKNYEGFGYQMTLWCTQCHTRYLGWNSSRSTTSGDATYMFRHSTSKYRVCSTCHVSHGSNAIMNVDPAAGGVASANLPFPDGVVHNKSLTSGDSRLLKLNNRGICLECHDPTGTAVGQQGPVVTTAP